MATDEFVMKEEFEHAFNKIWKAIDGDGQAGIRQNIQQILQQQAAQEVREEAYNTTLKEHGEILKAIGTTLNLIEERTKDMPELGKRVTKLEQWQWKWMGFTAAAVTFGGVVGWGLNLIFRR